MQTYLNENNLVDLISDKHAKLRKKVIEATFVNSSLFCSHHLQI